MRVALCLLLVCGLLSRRANALEQELDRSLKLPDGVHRLDKPLRIVADNVHIDLGDAELVGKNGAGDPDGFTGIGIHVVGRKKVTITGGKLRGFRCAILIENCEDITIGSVNVSRNFAQRLRSTPSREFSGDWLWPHNNDAQEWRKNYGAGICIEASKRVYVKGCVGRRMQNGLILDRSTECTVMRCDFSFNSGWGVALWRSSKNRIVGNELDRCVRGYSHGVYDRGQDSAGILVFEQCHENHFLANSATHGGDGFFLFAGNETLKKTGRGGCNNNVVEVNDFRFAVANALEATFSHGNKFRSNQCSGSNYGIWAGYSFDSEFVDNICHDNRYAGIAIEHGEGHVLRGNYFKNNPKGIWLWWDNDKELLASAFGKVRSCRSHGYRIDQNWFTNDRIGVHLVDTTDVLLRGNVMTKVGRAVVTDGKCGVVHEASSEEAPWPGATKPTEEYEGRNHIRIGPWGPLPPNEVAVFPNRVVAWGACEFFILGGKAFTVEGLPDTVVLERTDDRLRIRAKREGVSPFRGDVVIGKQRFAIAGTALRASWRVRHWNWTKDPRKHAAAWKAMLESKPFVDKTTGSLSFPWAGDGPTKDGPRDRFATRAETKLTLPAGRYELRTLSDDGVRVWIDGKLLQEDWTWHAPKENKTEVELAAGAHSIVIEHFEIDGHAVLSFDLLPLSSR